MKQLISIYILFFCIGCGNDETVSETPFLEFVSVNPKQVQAFEDNLIFTIFYQDGDGDLGENNPDLHNLFLKDNRNDIVYEYRIEQLAPDDANITIQGELNIELSGTGITDGSQEQSTTFDIYVIDRAGNKSNTITSSNIIIFQ
ncbi:MAG: hypothetical protein CMP66_03345 [Flavobacteriales bacterium]|nr:hypothetical protein [Flavobacteriales bacterium]|tara:strand:+ start:654 stop:1085 length:432 start_codon:yes stop_codon:yes gene_type:complete